MGIISDITHKYTRQADELIDQGVEQVGKWTGEGVVDVVDTLL